VSSASVGRMLAGVVGEVELVVVLGSLGPLVVAGQVDDVGRDLPVDLLHALDGLVGEHLEGDQHLRVESSRW
jgi:hypothetical protein